MTPLARGMRALLAGIVIGWGSGFMATLAAQNLAAQDMPVRAPTQQSHFADADDAALVARGRLVYARSCAACHGKRLQGQPLWQLRDEYWGRRAPAHDATGHTWGHSDSDLFQMVKYGRFPATDAQASSFMPSYADSLDDEQIVAVIAYIKARWPIGLRLAQALLNPNAVGMPSTQTEDWTFPPTCTTPQWRSGSR